MAIDPITSISRVAELANSDTISNTEATTSVLGNFDLMLTQALDHLNRVEGAANETVTRLAVGEDIELHQVMLTMQEADLAFQVALQIRNKLVEAYQEVMRMQV